ncbi:hypothetical protein ACTXK2_00505 [Arthrobacter rhombi]
MLTFPGQTVLAAFTTSDFNVARSLNSTIGRSLRGFSPVGWMMICRDTHA